MVSKQRTWRKLPLHVQHGARDPDSPLRKVELPYNLGIDAACALTDLFEDEEEISFPQHVETWLGRLTTTPHQAHTLIELLLARKTAPTVPFWTNSTEQSLGFVVNLAAFVDDDQYCSLLELTQTIAFLSQLLEQLRQKEGQHNDHVFTLYLTNTDLFLAKLGHSYDSEDGRTVSAIATYLCQLGVRSLHPQHGTLSLPPTFPCTSVHLRHFLRRLATALKTHSQHSFKTTVSFSTPNPIDRLLSVETCGCAPSFSLTKADGTLSWALIYRLAAQGFTPQSALASIFNGDLTIAPSDKEDYQRMFDKLATTGALMLPAPLHQTAAHTLYYRDIVNAAPRPHSFLRLVS